MSRNKEKANSLLHRYYNQKQDQILPTASTPRPKRVQHVTSIPVAEKFRSFVIRDISTKVTRINDSTVAESEIRNLNDEINKLINEKMAWEYHIRELGGPDYVNFSKKQLSKEVHVRNYRYFGRAKDLPDVKELLDLKKQQHKQGQSGKNTRQRNLSDPKELSRYISENLKKIDLFEYYDISKKLKKDKALKTNKDVLKYVSETQYPGITTSEVNVDNESERNAKRQKKDPSLQTFDEFNPPSMQEIEQILVERKKAELRKRLGI